MLSAALAVLLLALAAPLIVINAGPDDAAGVVVNDNLPAGITLVSTSDCAEDPNGAPTCTLGTIPADGDASYTLTVAVGAGATPGSSLFNFAKVSSKTPEASLGDETNLVETLVVSADDGDGVDDGVKDAAPNGGDGNGDGTPDSEQGTVASLPSATTGDYLTVETPDGCPLVAVAAIDPGTLPANPKPRPLSHGLVAFEIDWPTAKVTVLYHGSAAPRSWICRKLVPTPGEPAPHWYTPPAAFGTATVDGQSVATATFDLADAALGDDVLTLDDRIVDQGGPAELRVLEVPTLSPALLLLLALGLGGAGVLAVHRLAG